MKPALAADCLNRRQGRGTCRQRIADLAPERNPQENTGPGQRASRCPHHGAATSTSHIASGTISQCPVAATKASRETDR